MAEINTPQAMDVVKEYFVYSYKDQSKGDPMAKKVNRRKSPVEGRDDQTGYQHRIKAKKMDEANKSNSGCSKKLFMLLLPFAAVGTYLFLRS
jgi:hypothetical protein